MITTFDIGELMDLLVRELPRVGIPACYVALYDDPTAPTGPSHLIGGYSRQGQIALTPDIRHIPNGQLLPEGLLPADTLLSLVIAPLYFRDTHIGFAIFEVEQQDGQVYEVLRREISSALHGALLVTEVNRQKSEISMLNDRLKKRTSA